MSNIVYQSVIDTSSLGDFYVKEIEVIPNTNRIMGRKQVFNGRNIKIVWGLYPEYYEKRNNSPKSVVITNKNIFNSFDEARDFILNNEELCLKGVKTFARVAVGNIKFLKEKLQSSQKFLKHDVRDAHKQIKTFLSNERFKLMEKEK